MIWYAHYGIKVRQISAGIYNGFEQYECKMLRQYQTQAIYDNSIDDSKSADYAIQNEWIEFFNSLYLMGRSSYWKKSPQGCPCMTSPITVTDFFYNTSDSDVIKNMQGCEDKILGSYEEYDLVLNLKQFKAYFDYIGKIEQKYNWAGFCAMEDAYYFHDITVGPPVTSWDKALKDDLIPYNINVFAMNLLIISAILCLSLFVHFGLFQKQTPKIMAEEKIFNQVNTTTNHNITQLSRFEDESRVSKF